MFRAIRYPHIGRRVKKLRKERGWSQAYLAKLTGGSRPQVSRDERTGQLGIWRISRYAEVFKLTMSQLLQPESWRDMSHNRITLALFVEKLTANKFGALSNALRSIGKSDMVEADKAEARRLACKHFFRQAHIPPIYQP